MTTNARRNPLRESPATTPRFDGVADVAFGNPVVEAGGNLRNRHNETEVEEQFECGRGAVLLIRPSQHRSSSHQLSSR